jgi:hypothetical protein
VGKGFAHPSLLPPTSEQSSAAAPLRCVRVGRTIAFG